MDSVREGELHPLFNCHILEQIFRRMDLEDLKACRQVCRLWCESSAPAFRQLAFARITGKTGHEMEKIWSQFLELATQEDTAFPIAQFVNFKIVDLPSKHHVPTVFWELYGNDITYLELINISFESVDDFRHTIFQSCPNLEHLTLGSIDLNTKEKTKEPEGWIPPQFPQNRNLKLLLITSWPITGASFMDILSHFPSLEDLCCYSKMFVGNCALFDSLISCWSHDPHSWPIKRFGYSFESACEPLTVLPVFTSENFSLEELILEDYSLLSDDLNFWLLREMFMKTAKTLKRLEFRRIYPEAGKPFGDVFLLPDEFILENLEELNVRGASVFPLSFLRALPNLKKLDLYGIGHKGNLGRNIMKQDWTLEHCTELKLGHDEEWGKKFTAAGLRELLRRLPNLKKLVMKQCDNELFPVICELSTNLEYLDLKRSKVDDGVISGSDVEGINEEGENAPCGSSPRQNLSSLKNLKQFSLERPPNAGAEVGVQQLPVLEHLRIPGCPLPRWDRLCADIQFKGY